MSSLLTSRFRLGIAAVPSLLFVVIAFFAYPSLHARYLFHQLKTLELGHSTFDNAQQLAKTIDAMPSDPCNQSFREWDKRIDNAQFPRWWRGSGEAFVVAFDVENSVVSRKNTGFGIGDARSFSPSSVAFIEQEHWGRGNTPEPVAAGWRSSELFRYYEFTVYMKPKASARDRQRYTDFDYNCFWKYHGCKDARDLLPTADQFPE